MSAVNLASNLGKNLIINPTFDIQQRGSSFVGIGNGEYSLDRWFNQNNSAAVVDHHSSTDTPVPSQTGFYPNQYSLETRITTPDASVGATDFLMVGQYVEGHNFRKIYGKNAVYSFWVKSPKTGIHCVTFQNINFDRSYVSEYNITAANTWQKVTIRFKHDTTGTWDLVTGRGVRVNFTLMAGANHHTPQKDSWQNGNYHATANQVNVADAAGSFFVSQVQLHEGIDEIPFHKLARTRAQELLLCQRYFYALMDAIVGNTGTVVVGVSVNGATCRGQIALPIPMRILPAMTFSNLVDFVGEESGNTLVCTGLGAQSFNLTYSAIIIVFILTGGINKTVYSLTVDDAVGSYLHLDSEL